MRSLGPKHLLALSPAIALALVGAWLLVLQGRVVDGVIVLALGGLLGGLTYLALLGRRLLARQQQLTRRLGTVERLDRRAVNLARRSLDSHGAAADRGLAVAQQVQERNVQGLTRLEKLLLSQQQEISDGLTDLARRLDAQAAATAAAPDPSAAVVALASDVESLTKAVRAFSEETRVQLLGLKRHLHALEDGEHGGSLRKNLDADMAAVVAINRQAEAGVSLPVPSKWALSPQVLELTLRLVRSHPEIDLVVELGSGVSTPWIGDVLRSRGKGSLVSFEHDPRFLAATREAVVAAGVEEFVDLRLAPLVDVQLGGETFQWYDYGQDLSGVGLLLVDGPPGATGPTARYPAFPMFHSALSDGAFVILDDASRDDEKSILERWLEYPSEEVSLTLVDMVDRAALLRVSRER